VNTTSTMLAVHISLGHVGVGGGCGGSSVSMPNTNWPFRGVGSGPLVPATLTAVSWPGATFSPGFVHSVSPVPAAVTLISNAAGQALAALCAAPTLAAIVLTEVKPSYDPTGRQLARYISHGRDRSRTPTPLTEPVA
jgi:hypothetical protein